MIEFIILVFTWYEATVFTSGLAYLALGILMAMGFILGVISVCADWLNDYPPTHSDPFEGAWWAACIWLVTLFISALIAILVSLWQIVLTGLLFYGIMYALRGLVRLNKKLNKHIKDKEAHR